jgi:hypothetical protein
VKMTQVCLLDSNRLSSLLKDALSWSDAVSSLLVSAKNGSILAYAFKTTTPSIKTMRTKSATMTAAYVAASESTLIFESQVTGAISVITPVADHLLLAVNGAESDEAETTHQQLYSSHQQSTSGTQTDADAEDLDSDTNEEDRAQIRQDLEFVSQELAGTLREELASMKWPDDI